MKIKYDDDKIKDEEKLAICYRLYKLHQDEHNEKGRQYRSGHIKKSDWLKYKQGIYKNRMVLLSQELEKLKKKMKNNDTLNVSLKKNIEDE